MGLRITDLDVTRFTEGDCHFLARAIQKITDWPLCCFVSYDDDHWRVGQPSGHAFVETPNGNFLDIHGLWDEHSLREEWEYFPDDSDIMEFSWEWLRTEGGWKGPHFGDWTYARAKQLAPYLLDTHYFGGSA